MTRTEIKARLRPSLKAMLKHSSNTYPAIYAIVEKHGFMTKQGAWDICGYLGVSQKSASGQELQNELIEDLKA